MPGPDLTSIPLPADPSSKKVIRKTAKEMLQEALKDHKLASKTESNLSTKTASNKMALALGPKSHLTGSDGVGESSQSIVDELFKDFIAQKFSSGGRVRGAPAQELTASKGGNFDELSKILDMEISSIQSQTSVKDSSKSGIKKLATIDSSHKSSSLSSSKRSRSISTSSRDSAKLIDKNAVEKDLLSGNILSNVSQKLSSCVNSKKQNSLGISSAYENDHKGKFSESSNQASAVNGDTASLSEANTSSAQAPNISSGRSSTASVQVSLPNSQNSDSLPAKTSLMLPTQLVKKFGPPKMLGVKLSSESLSLIQSTDQIDRNGRVWEEGEVRSEESEKGNSDTEAEGYPSETGSVHSNAEDWKTHSSKRKKKHKHKHKRKKRKSVKEKDNEQSSEKTKDKETGKYERGRSRRDSEKHQDSRDKSCDRGHEGSKKKSREGDYKRKRSYSRSKSPKRHKKSKSRSRSYSKSPRSQKSWTSCNRNHSEWDAYRYNNESSKHSSKDCSRSRSRSKGRSSERHRRSRDKSGSRERDHSKERHVKDLRLQIDKAKLRKIAIANALQNMKSGQGPNVDLTILKSGGKSVQELTEFCKRIAEKSKSKQGSDSSGEEGQQQSEEEDLLLIHHPFKVKETSSGSIVMNIRNAKQLPVLTLSEKQAQQAALRLTFPVSSGTHHRANESEWVAVEKSVVHPTSTLNCATVSQAVDEVPPQAEIKKSDSIFPDPTEAQKIDIGTIITERLQAVRKLQENPFDMQALSKMHQVQEQASRWATSRHLPGQFLGSTGAHVLSQEELIGDKRHQAWAKKTQLSQAAPVNGGIGMFLLQKMGWKQGEGLGKNNEGSKEPLMLDVKIDRKGLTTATENSRNKAGTGITPRAKDLSNKHPVSALMELCNRRRWGPPVFTVVEESGPDHKKNFLFKVRVNNIEHQPGVPSSNKKTAKAQCAAVCLQEMGLIPRDAPLNI